MSKRWTASCWLGSEAGRVDLEVQASTLSGAKQQLERIYGAENIWNLRQVREQSDISPSSVSGGAAIVGLFAAAGLFLYFTPWVLMTAYGGAGTWLSQKITGQTLNDYFDSGSKTKSEDKKFLIVMTSAILCGMVGFIHGTSWNSELNKQYDLDGKQTKVEQVKTK